MQWKDVVGFEGLYFVSDTGLIRSNYKSKKILKPKKDKNGYAGVALYKDNKMNHLRVHRLVAIAFIPNPENKPFVNHKDLDVTNNSVDNLEWVTATENTKHFYENTLGRKTIAHLSKDEIRSIVDMYYEGKSYREIGVTLGIESRHDLLSEVVTGRRYSEVTGIQRQDNFRQRTTAKVDDQQILNILVDYYDNGLSGTDLVIKYGLSPAQISRICNGHRRKEVYNTFMKGR